MKLGVCYYPEHWSEDRWAVDADMMRSIGLEYVRIGEFSWAKTEPVEGVRDWSWLDKAVDILAGAGLQIIMGTPTATPPAWLVRKYPSMVQVGKDGNRREFGSRRHYCYNHAEYRNYVHSIVTELGQRYGEHASVFAWQIDNEFGCHDTVRCYCANCVAEFRKWLQLRYGTVDALNDAWGTVFWSQTYSDWSQIEAPILTVTDPNPAHVLDYNRFSSASLAQFQQIQVDLLRQYAPGKIITTNFMSDMTDADYPVLARPLDVISWDSYPTGSAEMSSADLYAPWENRPVLAYDTGDPYILGFFHSLMYGMKRKPTWIMEQQAGFVNWGKYNPGIRPGGVRLWTWHAAATGADNVIYFRWRACRYAQEQFHSGLLMHDASPAPGYREVLSLKDEREALDALTAGNIPAQVAIIINYEDIWATRQQPHREGMNSWRTAFLLYRSFMRLGINVHLVPPDAEMKSYRMVIAPSAFLGTDELTAHLRSYVRSGGTLLFCVRSGFKDENNMATDKQLPGVFRYLAGAGVTEWHALPPNVTYPLTSEIEGLEGGAGIWVEKLKADADSNVLIRYSTSPFKGGAALTEHAFGAGTVYYLGWMPDLEQSIHIMQEICKLSGIRNLTPLPEGITLHERSGQRILFNFTETDKVVKISKEEVCVPARGFLHLVKPE